jgi:putative transposase
MANRRYHVRASQDADKPYASDLSDPEFDIIAPLVAQKSGSGKKRTVNIRKILNAIFYRVRTGCQWRMLPRDFPPWNHVWYYYHTWRDDGTLERINTVIRQKVRVKAARDPEPSVAIIDSQSVATTEMGGEKGFNPHKQIKGRKRNIFVDTLGLLLFVVVCAASIQDSDAAEYIVRETAGRYPRLRIILVDHGYATWLVDLVKRWFSLVIEIATCAKNHRGFVVQPQRWKVERTFGWFNWDRLLSKEFERTTESSESDIYLASIRLMLRRLASSPK